MGQLGSSEIVLMCCRCIQLLLMVVVVVVVVVIICKSLGVGSKAPSSPLPTLAVISRSGLPGRCSMHMMMLAVVMRVEFCSVCLTSVTDLISPLMHGACLAKGVIHNSACKPSTTGFDCIPAALWSRPGRA